MRLLVLGDSLTFHGPQGPLPADHPRLWPNIAAAELGGHAELAAGFGWTARDAWWALTGDPRVWSLLPRTDVLVFAVGHMDTLPSPLPTYLRHGLRHLRPDGLRRRARAAYRAAQPVLSRLLGGRPVALPPHLTERYLTDSLHAVRQFQPGVRAIGMLPSVHCSPLYAGVHTGRAAGERAVRAWADRAGVPLVDVPALVGEHVRARRGNPDGMHWGWEGHRLVGTAVARLVSSAAVDDPGPAGT
ncbi:diglucosylglycerate octanoyltransferase [Saccharothrix coeruleofusca]|uniref:Lysophospholipase n=1 Tax=Saccharothrix coeruleofusca TaxID=33919 RepID=A0A918AI24_9PSEU|nr:diglucosylglycerate octanoyltransferase [Saccharothrix coeruleofusca]MBP2334218.1 lysophospholipase L1-like esterase [Saccharothrix coeruleofusca]GGP42603.1 lysophospholipase [Saccharothrix coeruleofusca]